MREACEREREGWWKIYYEFWRKWGAKHSEMYQVGLSNREGWNSGIRYQPGRRPSIMAGKFSPGWKIKCQEYSIFRHLYSNEQIELKWRFIPYYSGTSGSEKQLNLTHGSQKSEKETFQVHLYQISKMLGLRVIIPSIQLINFLLLPLVSYCQNKFPFCLTSVFTSAQFWNEL